MIERRTQRRFSDSDSKELVEALRACRTASIEASRKLPPYNNPTYTAVGSFIEEIDRLAGVLTDDPTFFHLPLHSTHSGPLSEQPALPLECPPARE